VKQRLTLSLSFSVSFSQCITNLPLFLTFALTLHPYLFLTFKQIKPNTSDLTIDYYYIITEETNEKLSIALRTSRNSEAHNIELARIARTDLNRCEASYSAALARTEASYSEARRKLDSVPIDITVVAAEKEVLLRRELTLREEVEKWKSIVGAMKKRHDGAVVQIEKRFVSERGVLVKQLQEQALTVHQLTCFMESCNSNNNNVSSSTDNNIVVVGFGEQQPSTIMKTMKMRGEWEYDNSNSNSDTGSGNHHHVDYFGFEEEEEGDGEIYINSLHHSSSSHFILSSKSPAVAKPTRAAISYEYDADADDNDDVFSSEGEGGGEERERGRNGSFAYSQKLLDENQKLLDQLLGLGLSTEAGAARRVSSSRSN
jgi:hypothetical protein